MPTDLLEKSSQRATKPLAALQRYQAPNLLILSRAQSPLPMLKSIEEEADKAAEENDDENDQPGTKLALVGMSKKSSFNLSRVLSCLDWKKNGLCLHVTLTYHHRWPSTKEELQAEKSGLTATLGLYLCGIWRLEFQSRETDEERSARMATGQRRKRGQGGSVPVPHWHLLVWIGDRDPDEVVTRIQRWWAQFSGNLSEKACKVTFGDQARGNFYLSAHAAKRAQAPAFKVGRWWGWIKRKKVLEAADLHNTGEVIERERVWLARLYRRSTGKKFISDGGFSWFLPRRWQQEVLCWVRDRIGDEKATTHKPKNPF